VFSRSAEIYDAVYSFKDYAAEAERVNERIQSRRPGAASLLDGAGRASISTASSWRLPGRA